MFDNEWHFSSSDLCIEHLPSWLVMCALGVAAAGSAQHKPCAGLQVWGCCTFHLQPQLHLSIKAVICWGERHLQTLRHCLKEPQSLPRRCLFSKHYVQQRCHIYQLLQQPNGHRTSSQHMGGGLDQEQTVTGITCQTSRLANRSRQ